MQNQHAPRSALSTSWTPTASRRVGGGLLPAAMLVAAGWLAGTVLAPHRHVEAEVRDQSAPQAFKTGADRSEPVLREILAVLKTMDGRLERIESAMNKRNE
jgi:hypothetical protein